MFTNNSFKLKFNVVVLFLFALFVLSIFSNQILAKDLNFTAQISNEGGRTSS